MVSALQLLFFHLLFPIVRLVPGCWPTQVLPLGEEVQRGRQRGGSRRRGEQARGKLVPPGCRGQDWDLWFAFFMKGMPNDCAPRPGH